MRPEWVDYNGHMNDAYYAVVLSEANEELLEWLGMSESYRAETNAGFYTVETHIRYLDECSRGQVLSAASTVIDADAKRLRVHTELFADDTLAATAEVMYLHVDGNTGRSAPMPADRQALVDRVAAAHAELARPAHLGKGVGDRS